MTPVELLYASVLARGKQTEITIHEMRAARERDNISNQSYNNVSLNTGLNSSNSWLPDLHQLICKHCRVAVYNVSFAIDIISTSILLHCQSKAVKITAIFG